MNVSILPNGDLRLAANNQDRADIKEMQAHNIDSLSILADLLEPYWTNGGFESFDSGEGNPFVGLTSAPCIAESLTTHDDGQREIEGRLWFFANYMLHDSMDDLKKRGSVIFSLAPGWNKPEFYDCGICGHYHPIKWNGDCRDDANRFPGAKLDEMYTAGGWDEVPMPV